MTAARPPRAQDGYVLISVLSVIALLSGLVAALLLLGRTATDTADLESRALTEDALAQSAVTLAGYQLFVLKRPEGAVNGQQVRLDRGIVTLTVLSEAGKVDLNGSGRDLLAAAYRAAGLTALPPEVFAARVMDWRDADDEAMEHGAEAEAYQAAGLAFQPRNGPFRSVDDLRTVPGVAAGDLDALRPFLTVFNAPGRLSVYAAPEALIAALPKVDAQTVREVLTLRADRTSANAATLADRLLVQAALIDATPPRTYRVRIDIAPNDGGPPKSLSVVLSAGATPQQPFHVLDWSMPMRPDT